MNGQGPPAEPPGPPRPPGELRPLPRPREPRRMGLTDRPAPPEMTTRTELTPTRPDDQCRALSPSGQRCIRDSGHEIPHVVRNPGGYVYRWSDG